MISKLYKIRLFLILILFSSCAFQKKIEKKTVIDINGKPIIENFHNNKCKYIDINNNSIEAYLNGIEFYGGDKRLKNYLDSIYYNNSNYKNKYEDCFNITERFFVLFDKDLNISEIRIMYRKYANNERFYYDSIFVNALKSTNGRWHKTIQNKKWYIYLHVHNVN